MNIDHVLETISNKEFKDLKDNELKESFDFFRNITKEEFENVILMMKNKYFEGEPLIFDSVYDNLVTVEYKNRFPDGEAIDEIGEENFDNLEKIFHKTPMLSTNKAYTKEELTLWINKVNKSFKKLNIEEKVIRVTPKLDGMAGRHLDNKLVTRGKISLGFGFNVTHIYDLGIEALNGIKDGNGEIVLSKKYFDKHLSEKFAHPRNVVVGIVKAKEISEEAKETIKSKKIKFIRYDEMNAIYLTIEELIEILKTNDFYDYCYENLIEKTDFEYPIDGFVLEVQDSNVKDDLGSNSKFHNWMMALKKYQDYKTAVVKDVVLQTGRTGRITPVVNIETVNISGANISRATAHNVRYLEDNKINTGAIINLIRSGEVIPKIVGVEKPSEIKLEIKCPSCGGEIDRISDGVYECMNKLHCHAQLLNSIVYHFKVLDIKNFGEKTVDKLISKGLINSFMDVYNIKKEDLINIGFGDKTSENLIKERQRCFEEKFDKDQIIASVGIKDFARGMASKLLEHYSFEDIINVNLMVDDIVGLEGFDKISANNIINGLSKSKDILKELVEIGISYKEKTVANNDSVLFNKKIIFTGTMKMGSRKEMESYAKSMGADIQKSVSKKTDILVYGDEAGSKKDKAEKLGLKCLSEKEYIEHIKG